METEAETGLRRLRRLERVLLGVEAEGMAFYMGNWIVELEELEEDGVKIVSFTGGARKTCGTACCAGGYAALDPELMAEGLHLAGRGFRAASDWIQVDSQEQFATLGRGAANRCIRFGSEYDYGALAKFFGITPEESLRIFEPHSYIPLLAEEIRIQDVLERVRNMVAKVSTGDPTGDGMGDGMGPPERVVI
jgi:hypothetical protein